MVTTPAPVEFAYTSAPTRNPFRYPLALWRSIRNPTDTYEVGIVELGFARSRLGRRFARWEEVIEVLRRDPRTAPAMQRRRACEPIDLGALGGMPQGTLGRVFAEHCQARALNPNLVYVAPGTEVDWMLHHLYLTHDIWHVVTGWGNDEIGEYGLGGFYIAQLGGPTFFGFLQALAILSTIFRRRSFREFSEAVYDGYGMGKRADPLFGVSWASLWETPLEDVRTQFKIESERVMGEGIRSAA